jgi:hypothetical protein
MMKTSQPLPGQQEDTRPCAAGSGSAGQGDARPCALSVVQDSAGSRLARCPGRPRGAYGSAEHRARIASLEPGVLVPPAVRNYRAAHTILLVMLGCLTMVVSYLKTRRPSYKSFRADMRHVTHVPLYELHIFQRALILFRDSCLCSPRM